MAHDDFRIILTSNPHDYAGVKTMPDALLDRVVTFQLPDPDQDRLAGIVSTRTGLDPKTSARIVATVLAVRDTGAATQADTSVMRSAILIARAASYRIRFGTLSEGEFCEIACDVLAGRGWKVDPALVRQTLAPAKQQRKAS